MTRSNMNYNQEHKELWIKSKKSWTRSKKIYKLGTRGATNQKQEELQTKSNRS